MERMHHYWGFIFIHSSKYGKDAYWGFMSIHSSKYGKDASLLASWLHVYWGFMSIRSSKYGKDASLLGLHVIHSSKHGKDASLLELHVHTLLYVWKGCITTGASYPYTPSLERMHHYWA